MLEVWTGRVSEVTHSVRRWYWLGTGKQEVEVQTGPEFTAGHVSLIWEALGKMLQQGGRG